MNNPADTVNKNKGFWLALLSISALLLYLLAPVLMPFLVAALLAYLGDPIVDRLEKYKFPRAAAVSSVFLLIFLVLIALPVIVLPLLEQQMTDLLQKLPRYVQWFQENVNSTLGQLLNIDATTFSQEEIKQAITKYWQQIGGFAGQIFKAMTASGLVLMALVANAILIPVVTFYLLRDWDILVDKIHKLLPRQYEQKISEVVKESDDVLGAFLRGQLMVMIALSIVYAVGLSLTGLDLAILIGLVAGLVSFVPYLGFIVGIVFASVATYMQFQDLISLLPVLAVFTVGQLLEGMVLTPKLVGDKIGLHPVAVIFAVMAGGQLFGVVGVLLALPVAAVIVVILRHSLDQYTNSSLYRG